MGRVGGGGAKVGLAVLRIARGLVGRCRPAVQRFARIHGAGRCGAAGGDSAAGTPTAGVLAPAEGGPGGDDLFLSFQGRARRRRGRAGSQSRWQGTDLYWGIQATEEPAYRSPRNWVFHPSSCVRSRPTTDFGPHQNLAGRSSVLLIPSNNRSVDGEWWRGPTGAGGGERGRRRRRQSMGMRWLRPETSNYPGAIAAPVSRSACTHRRRSPPGPGWRRRGERSSGVETGGDTGLA